MFQTEDYTAELVNEIKTREKDESSDEELKLQDDISNDDAEITFDLNDEEFDIFGERSETVYSKHEGASKLIKAQDFTLKRLLRTTETGKVYLAQLNDDGKCYALKSINKDLFIKRFNSLKIEKELKSQLQHPFISSLEFVFQNDYRIYLVSELLRGGDLESLIKKEGNLKEEQIKFYTTQLVLVLGFLHSNGIVYRNLKASNVLINSDGYIKLGDFDFCGRVAKFGLSNSFCKLVEYQAPEVIANKGHDHTIDWWALGVLLNQMLCNENNYDNIPGFPQKSQTKKLETSTVNDAFVQCAKDLISKLLEKDKDKRIGAQNDAAEILEHRFFDDINVEEILSKKTLPSYMPFIHPNDPYYCKTARQKVLCYISNFNVDLLKFAPRESMIMPDEKERIIKEADKMRSQFEEYLRI